MMKFGSLANRSFRPVARVLSARKMELLGIRNTMRIARAYNVMLDGKYLRYRKEQYNEHFDELLEENGWEGGAANRMVDGYALDTSQTLPHLDALLNEADTVIEERGGKTPPDETYRAFFRHLTTVEDLKRFPVLIDFVTSSALLKTVCEYLHFIPCLPKELPPGVRFVESSTATDALAHLPPRDSQLTHMDPYDTPEVYVIVVLRDITPDHGPFCFFPESVSQKAARELRYWQRGRPFRLSDEEFYGVVSKSERIELTYPRGTVLFIDPSRCFHYGSRNCTKPRHQLMFALASPCRCDFSETFRARYQFPIAPTDSRLRRMVLARTSMQDG